MGGVSAYHNVHLTTEPGWWVAASTVIAGALVFAWYFLDSESHKHLRSKWLNIGVVALAFVAVPYYLLRSRPKGKKGVALLRCIGFVIFIGIFNVVGATLYSVVG